MGIKQQLVTEKCRGWTWHLRQAGLLDGWFEQYEKFVHSSVVKSNKVRTVFKVEDKYFVKIDRPSRLDHRVRAYFRCKAEVEFKTAMLLEKAGLPLVKYSGWGRRGQHSMVFSEAMTDAVSLQSFIVNHFELGGADYSGFLLPFTEFLRKIFKSGFYHPDFHVGNILFDRIRGNFALVDVYGINRPRVFSQSKLDAMQRVVFGLKNILSDREMVNLIMELGIRRDRNDATQYYYDGLGAEAAQVVETWHKRRRQILGKYHKFITSVKCQGEEYLLRHTAAAEPFIAVAALPDLLAHEHMDKVVLRHYDALRLWLNSFKLQFFGIAHRKPLVMAEHRNTATLYFEHCDGRPPLVDSVACTEFMKHCEICGIYPEISNLRQNPAGKIYIDQIQDIKLI